jgi:hypothetical protein
MSLAKLRRRLLPGVKITLVRFTTLSDHARPHDFLGVVREVSSCSKKELTIEHNGKKSHLYITASNTAYDEGSDEFTVTLSNMKMTYHLGEANAMHE